MAALDFFSASFDPLLALNTPGLRPPIADVKPLISVQMCRSLLPDDHSDYKPPKQPTTQQTDAQHSTTAIQPPTQRASPTTGPNPLALFSTAARVPPSLSSSASSVGPLVVLQSLVATQQRCRVLLRSHHSLHSIVTGQLRAFDRHCNLYIVEAQQSHRTTARLPVSERQRRRAGGGAAGSGRKWEWVEVERRVGVWQKEWVGQLMVRGECVMSVGRCSDASEAADALITGIDSQDNG